MDNAAVSHAHAFKFTPMSIIGQTVFYGLFAVIVGYFSTGPRYQHLAPDQALIKLSFSHHGQPVTECRKRTAEELANAKSGIMQQRVQNRAQDGTLAGAWASLLHLGRTFAYSKAFEDKLMALAVDDVNAALRKHLDPARVTIVKAGDFKK